MTDELFDLKFDYVIAKIELKILKQMMSSLKDIIGIGKRQELELAYQECLDRIDVLATKIEDALKG